VLVPKIIGKALANNLARFANPPQSCAFQWSSAMLGARSVVVVSLNTKL
jgi:hypothetical protein